MHQLLSVKLLFFKLQHSNHIQYNTRYNCYTDSVIHVVIIALPIFNTHSFSAFDMQCNIMCYELASTLIMY